jgi:hypothetical protein
MTMKVVETTLGTERSYASNSLFLTIIENVLRKLIPLANPDFDSSYALVRKWWIEIDDTGTPQRELGFDGGGKVIVAGPLGGPSGENFGYFTDSTMTFNSADYVVVSEKAFGTAWSQFEQEINMESDT